jgi:translation elongation factor EF-G
MPAGRPLKFTPEEVEKNIEAYFESCFKDIIVRDKEGNVVLDDKGRPYTERLQVEPFTITGLALGIGFSCRQMMDEYMAKEEFGDIIKRAKARVEHFYEKGLHSATPVGRIFGLKNMGWKDKQEVEVSGKDGGPLVVLVEGGLNPDVYGPGSSG